MTSILLAAGDAPVIDIDWTFFIQLGLFLLLMAVLNPLLFKPWLAVQERRASAIDGALTRAAELRARADALAADHAARMASAREEALGLRSDARRQVEGERQQLLAGAREEAGTMLDGARARMLEQSTEARAVLAARVDEIAQQMANRILRRSS